MKHYATIAARPLDEILEKDWQQQVVQIARQLGWTRIYHTHDSRKSAHGFPDLVLVRDRVILAELKREKTRATDEQKNWLRALHDANAEVYLLRPRHLQQLAFILAARRQPLGPLTTPAARAARQQLRDELRKEIDL